MAEEQKPEEQQQPPRYLPPMEAEKQAREQIGAITGDLQQGGTGIANEAWQRYEQLAGTARSNVGREWSSAIEQAATGGREAVHRVSHAYDDAGAVARYLPADVQRAYQWATDKLLSDAAYAAGLFGDLTKLLSEELMLPASTLQGSSFLTTQGRQALGEGALSTIGLLNQIVGAGLAQLMRQGATETADLATRVASFPIFKARELGLLESALAQRLANLYAARAGAMTGLEQQILGAGTGLAGSLAGMLTNLLGQSAQIKSGLESQILGQQHQRELTDWSTRRVPPQGQAGSRW